MNCNKYISNKYISNIFFYTQNSLCSYLAILDMKIAPHWHPVCLAKTARVVETNVNGRTCRATMCAISEGNHSLSQRLININLCPKIYVITYAQSFLFIFTVLQYHSSWKIIIIYIYITFWDQFLYLRFQPNHASRWSSKTLKRRWTEVPMCRKSQTVNQGPFYNKSAVQQTRSSEDSFNGHQKISLHDTTSKTLERRWTEVPMCRKSKTGVKSGTVLQQISSSTNKVFWGQLQWASKSFARWCYQ